MRRYEIEDRHGWGYALLVLVTAAMFVRPGELIAQIAGYPIYQILIIACLFIASRTLWNQLFCLRFADRPMTSCLFVLVMAVFMSHLVHGNLWGARDSAWNVTKQVALYVLIVGLINTPNRLRAFVGWITILTTITAALSLFDFIGWIQLNAIDSLQELHRSSSTESGTINRIRGTGIFEDPNDLGLVIVTGLVFCMYFMTQDGLGWPRYVWAIPMIVLGTTLGETQSRGAFISLAAAIPAWFFYQRGTRLAILGSLLFVPVLIFGFAGRMTEIDAVYEGTGQTRLQIWSDAFDVFRSAPLFGIGEGAFADTTGFVAHNSFLQAFAELGVLGGCSFLAVFLTGSIGLTKLTSSEDTPSEVTRLRGFVFAAIVGYSVGIFALSRQFVGPTFIILGLSGATQAISNRDLGPAWKLGIEYTLRVLLASALLLIATYLLIRIFVQR